MSIAHFTDALTGRPFTHLHFDSAARDCDGRYDRSGVEVPKEGETFRQLWDWRVAHERRYLHTEGEGYRASLAIEDRLHETYAYDGYDEDQDRDARASGVYAYPVLTVYKDTDEGYSSKQWSMCSGEYCINDRSTFRDHTAEAAGY